VPEGAPPDEADVLVQADAVAGALAGLGHAVATLDCDLDLARLQTELAARRPDTVFNLVEGLAGSGRLIHLVPAVLAALGIPFAGCTADAFAVTSHKVLAKRLLRGAALPTPDWLTAETADGPAAAAAPDRRWIIKSVWEDASLGLDDDAVVTAPAAAVRARLAARAGQAGAPWFAEEYIAGREFNIALLDGPDGPTVLPHAEMEFRDFPPGKPHIVGYAAKWHDETFEFSHTVRRFDLPPEDAPLLAELSRLSLACWRAFDLRGWARVDFRVDAAGRPWILEANVNPCLAPDAGFAAALDRAGIPFQDAVARMLTAAG